MSVFIVELNKRKTSENKTMKNCNLKQKVTKVFKLLLYFCTCTV